MHLVAADISDPTMAFQVNSVELSDASSPVISGFAVRPLSAVAVAGSAVGSTVVS